LLSIATRRCNRTTSWIDPGFSLTPSVLPFIAQTAEIGIRIRLVPTLARTKTPEAVRRSGGAFADDNRLIIDGDVEPVPSFDAEACSHFAWYDNLILAADLDA
jgi:hypothetical protein